MGGEASKAISKEELWGGGRSPFSVSYGKMMMWFFLVSDALTFGGLLTAYGVSRAEVTEVWPIGEQVFESFPGLGNGLPLAYVALMTFILIVSSVTMVLAVEAGHRNDKKGVLKWMGYTIIGGFFFLGSQAWEWSHFIHGSGGYFQVNSPVTITYTGEDENGNEAQLEYTVAANEAVYTSGDFGHAMEHYLVHGFFHDAHGHDADGHGHNDHAHGAADAHGDDHAADNHGEHGDDAAHAAGHGEASHDEHTAHVLLELEHLGIDEAKLLSITGQSSVHGALEYAAEQEHAGNKIFLPHAMPADLMLNKYIENRIELDSETDAAQIAKLYDVTNVTQNAAVFGATLSANEYGPTQYAQFFFFVTGFHGFHVFSGVVINIIIFLMAYRGVFERRGHYEMVEKVGLYWHFVDLVWVFVFTFFYLI